MTRRLATRGEQHETLMLFDTWRRMDPAHRKLKRGPLDAVDPAPTLTVAAVVPCPCGCGREAKAKLLLLESFLTPNVYQAALEALRLVVDGIHAPCKPTGESNAPDHV